MIIGLFNEATDKNGNPCYHNCLIGTAASADLVVTPFASEVPIPGALPLFATGLGALGLLGWRRKRKQTA